MSASDALSALILRCRELLWRLESVEMRADARASSFGTEETQRLVRGVTVEIELLAARCSLRDAIAEAERAPASSPPTSTVRLVKGECEVLRAEHLRATRR